jgi:hypothetical protein
MRLLIFCKKIYFLATKKQVTTKSVCGKVLKNKNISNFKSKKKIIASFSV